MKQPDEVLGVKIGEVYQRHRPLGLVSPLPVELFRRSGMDGVANKVLPAKESTKGLRQGQTVQSFVLLSALAGTVLKICSVSGMTLA
jgi:hypothetical protein